jgi:predicted transposase/invertase (TIGR01784 family)
MTLSVKSDLLFKRCFANAAHPEVVENFIRDVLGLDVSSITIENPYSIEEFIDVDGNQGLRHTEVDVLVRLSDQSLVTTEIQRAPQTYYMPRSIYYLASRYTDDYGRKNFEQATVKDGSEKYSSLFPVYGINIVDFALFDDDRLRRTFSFRDDDTFEPLSQGMLHLCYIELRKELGKEAPAHLRHWVDFLSDKPAGANVPDYIKQAYELVDIANLNKEERKMISAAERREQDLIGQMRWAQKVAMAEGKAEGRAEGKAEGKAEGRAEGEAQGLAKVAKNLLAAGMAPNEIAEVTGLSVQEIENLH